MEKVVHGKRIRKPAGIVFSCLVLCSGLLACNSNQPAGSTPASQPATQAVLQPTFTEPPVPSPTPLPPLVLLVAPPGGEGGQIEDVQMMLAELAKEDGLSLEMRSGVVQSDLTPEVRLVVVLPPDPGVKELADANPEIQFLGIGIPDLPTSPNLSAIGSGGNRPDQQGFLAGYLATVITQDWRVGVISPSDTNAGRAARQGFVNGVIFYCGLCRPAYPPFTQYPVFVELPGGATEDEQKAAVDYVVGSSVETVYVYPELRERPLMEYLAEAGINIIGGISPPVQFKDQWVASVSVDLTAAIERIWPDLVGGEGGIYLDTPLVLTDRNEALFSLGRQRLVEKMLAELLVGYIDTGVDPLTGEPY